MKTAALFLSLALLAPALVAETASSASPLKPKPELTTITGSPAHLTSPQTSARLSAALPKFSPARPTSATEQNEAADSTHPDQPKNAIIRLPRYEVLDRKLPVFRERELLTAKGRVALAYKRHPGLRFGPFSFLNAKWGLAMLEEEQALERAAELAELTHFQQQIETTSSSTSTLKAAQSPLK
jgi:hypothetical protein